MLEAFWVIGPGEDLVDQPRLFRLAVEDGWVQFHHVAGRGWELKIRCRRGDELWDESAVECYEALTTVELLDTIAAVLDGLL